MKEAGTKYEPSRFSKILAGAVVLGAATIGTGVYSCEQNVNHNERVRTDITREFLEKNPEGLNELEKFELEKRIDEVDKSTGRDVAGVIFGGILIGGSLVVTYVGAYAGASVGDNIFIREKKRKQAKEPKGPYFGGGPQ